MSSSLEHSFQSVTLDKTVTSPVSNNGKELSSVSSGHYIKNDAQISKTADTKAAMKSGRKFSSPNKSSNKHAEDHNTGDSGTLQIYLVYILV